MRRKTKQEKELSAERPLSLICEHLCRKQGENKAATLCCSGQELAFTPAAINEIKGRILTQRSRSKPIAMPAKTFLPSQWSAAVASDKTWEIYRGFVFSSSYMETSVSPIHLGFFSSLCNIYSDAWEGGGVRVLQGLAGSLEFYRQCAYSVIFSTLLLGCFGLFNVWYRLPPPLLQAGPAGRSCCQKGRASPIPLPFAEPDIRQQ